MTGAQGGRRGAFRGRRAVTQRRAKSANMVSLSQVMEMQALSI